MNGYGDYGQLNKAVLAGVRRHKDTLIKVSQELWDDPEGPMAEHRSARRVADVLSEGGFDVNFGVGGLPTAFTAEYGSGNLTVVLCAEYDALKGFKDKTDKNPEGFGHACGHNLIAATSVGAGLALKEVADEAGIKIRVVGTPGEEGLGGKIILLEQGVFDDAHMALMAHGAGIDRTEMQSVANSPVEFRFVGRPAHAAASPQLGKNALDAAVSAYVNVGLGRQQIPPGSIENIRLNGDGATNVIADRALLKMMIRHADINVLRNEIEPAVWAAIQGGAVGAQVGVVAARTSPTYAATNSDPRLVNAYVDAAAEQGREVVPLQPGDPSASTDHWNLTGTPQDPAIPGIHPLFSVTGRQDRKLGLHSPEMMNASNPRHNAAPREAIEGISTALALTAVKIAVGADRESFTERSWNVAEVLASGERPAYLPEEGWRDPTVLAKGNNPDPGAMNAALDAGAAFM